MNIPLRGGLLLSSPKAKGLTISNGDWMENGRWLDEEEELVRENWAIMEELPS